MRGVFCYLLIKYYCFPFFLLLPCKSITIVSFVYNWPVALMHERGDSNASLIKMVLKKPVSWIYHAPWDLVWIETSGANATAVLVAGSWAVAEPFTPRWEACAASYWAHGQLTAHFGSATLFLRGKPALLFQCMSMLSRVYRSTC